MLYDYIFYHHFPILVLIEQWSFDLHHAIRREIIFCPLLVHENITENVVEIKPFADAKL